MLDSHSVDLPPLTGDTRLFTGFSEGIYERSSLVVKERR